MVFALTPVQSAFATHDGSGARDTHEAGDVCEGRDRAEFDDIANEDTDEAAECLNDLGIAYGFTDGDYRPTNAITREQMASFLARKMQAAVEFETDENYPEADYTDRDKIAAAHIANVDLITAEGVGEGFEDGRYGPGEPVTRGQMASFIVREMETIAGVELTAEEDHFTDDDGTFHEDNINVLADYGIAEGDANGNYNPHASVTRGQMALFIARNVDALNDEFGITFESIRDDETPTNQTFTVTPSGEQTVETGEDVQFTATDITSDTVDLALFACEDVTIDDDGNVVFEDANNDGIADWNTGDTAATITEVNGVSGTFGDKVNDVTVGDDGSITFTVQTNADECVVAVVWDDADDDNNLDVDADGLPTEDFAIGAFLSSGQVAALDATPESEVNRFGTDHTVTATLEDNDGDVVALDGEVIRFQVYRAGACDTTGNTNPTGTVVATGSDTTEDGVATFTYTVSDPSTGNDADINDCILVFWDENNNSVNDDTHRDVVSKTWSDDPSAASSLELEPDTDTNLVGTQHTVTATVTDQFGDPIDTNVTFEVHREGAASNPMFTATRPTGADGEASFTYSGPATSEDDVIIACVEEDDPADGCDATATFTPESADTGSTTELDDHALKYWVENAAATDTADGEVVGVDKDANTVDVDDTVTDDNLRFSYDVDDTFSVTCAVGGGTQPANMNEFEQALSVGDTLDVTAEDVDGDRHFHLTDEDC